MRISKIEKVNGSHKVYDIEVDIDHSFIVAGCVLHNSKVCASLDGMRFKIGEGPLPPIHPNCRSVVTPVLSERFDFLKEGATRPSKGADGVELVPSDQTYYSWLKDQPVAFQNDAIGATRAKLLRDGGLSSEEFARLSLDKNFQPLTLDAMESKAPAVFEKAGVD